MDHKNTQRELEETLKKIERAIFSFSKTTRGMQKEHEAWLSEKKIHKISSQLAENL